MKVPKKNILLRSSDCSDRYVARMVIWLQRENDPRTPMGMSSLLTYYFQAIFGTNVPCSTKSHNPPGSPTVRGSLEREISMAC